ncbi:uncharacterized protein LOC126969869 [Leptidea sinapis]|uniref:uncharacterized protein LOC126969869 n=1 Tax=Leptidea sinapis TaxID=189913 RepID=UPI0021405C80|nr:uncharacterized protein LOC126969869 [Leptidea sinapis]
MFPQMIKRLKEFIRLWETYPELWNISSKAYRDKLKKNIALDNLLVIYKKIKPSSTREDVKKKLNSLRTNFRKELKTVFQSKASGKGTDELYVPSSWTYYELLFLKNDEQPIPLRQRDNIDRETQEQEKYSVSSMDPPATPPTPTQPKKKKVSGIDHQTFMEQ